MRFTPRQAINPGHPTNAIGALLLGAYLLAVLWQGNLGKLAGAARDDFFGQNGQPAFWRWAAAMLVLVMLANSRRANWLFGPILGVSLVAMLINVANADPQAIQNLRNGLAQLYGYQPSNGG